MQLCFFLTKHCAIGTKYVYLRTKNSTKMEARIKYPIGIQSFEKLRNAGQCYVDKTDLMYDLLCN